MAITWTPEPPMPFIDCSESDLNVIGSIVAASDDPADAVVSVSWRSLEDLPQQFVVLTTTDTVTVQAPDLVGIFKIVEILYLNDGTPGRCDDWQDLPGQAEDVVAYRPDPVNVKDFIVEVSAQTQLGASQSGSFIIRVYANYTPGRDQLQEEVDARR